MHLERCVIMQTLRSQDYPHHQPVNQITRSLSIMILNAIHKFTSLYRQSYCAYHLLFVFNNPCCSIQASSSGQVESMQAACSNAVSADSMMSNPGVNVDPNLCFTTRQARSSFSLSFSGLTGESSGGDYQDCGMSSTLVMGEPPWYPSGPESSSFPTASRDSAVIRYKEKKKRRK